MNRTVTTYIGMLLVVLASVGSAWLHFHQKDESDVKLYDADDPFSAAEHGDLEAVKRHVATDPKVLQKTRVGDTMLHFAALYNQPEVIRYLVKRGAKVDQLSENSHYTPLFMAARSQKAHAVKSGRVLIELGADANWRLGRIGPYEIVGGLGAPAGTRSWWWSGGKTDGRSVLDMAAKHGHAGLVELLLKKGASPFTYKTYRGRKYLVRTALHKACQGPIAAAYLNSKDVRMVREYEDNHKVIEALLPVVKDINIKDVDDRTPLHIAAMRSQAKIADYLLKTYPKLDINAKDERGNTPLHLAIRDPRQRRLPNLQSAKLVPEGVIRRRAEKRIVATIKVLLKHKPDLTIKNLDAKTPRDLAHASGNKAIMALFK